MPTQRKKPQTKTKPKVGRPSKYQPEFCDRVPELMQNGLAIEEVAAELRVALSTLYLWRENYSEFSEAIKKGEDLSRAWWMARGRLALNDKEFNATLWYMNMKNRHGWTDRREDTIKMPDTIKVVYVKPKHAEADE